MNKTIVLIVVIVLLATGSYFVFAQDPMDGGMMGSNMQQRGMRGSPIQNRGMMGSMMRSSSLVASPDGGIIALMGNELSKYDNDLNLVKQVGINFNWDKWQKTMMQHRDTMMQNNRMMGWGGMMGSMMRSSSIVAGTDGGVIVLMGNELFKYDKDLNLVKQIEINFNWDNWQKMMMHHRNMMMNWSQQSGSQSSQGE
jgi:CRP-like cAMP-binding protein